MKNVLLLGEICDDIHVYGHCNRLNPEAPTPVLSREYEKHTIGMAGNVAANLYSLSENTINIKIQQHNNSESITKIRYVDKKHGYILLRVDDDVKICPIYRGLVLDLRQDILNQKFDAVVISDYNKGFLASTDIATITDAATKVGISVFLDTKKEYSTAFDLIDFIKINNIEYQQNGWNKYTGKGQVIVTLGEKGAVVYDRNGLKDKYLTTPRQVVNVSGAGDTFLAGFVISILNGQSLSFAVEYANAAAGVAVTYSGVVAVKNTDIK